MKKKDFRRNEVEVIDFDTCSDTPVSFYPR
jgi:hypothetical protein